MSLKNCEPDGTRFCQSCGEMLTDDNRGEFDTACYYCQERNVDDRDMDDNKVLAGVE